jgi:hypothetical protein
MRGRALLAGLLHVPLSWGCVTPRDQENPDAWYDPGSAYDVSEPVEFTDVNYDFTGPTPIAELPVPPDFGTIFAEGALPEGTACADWTTVEDLPAEIEGIVTVLPRYYFKTSGCQPDQSVDEDEKYYGSYFIQDASGGYFVLGDSKVAHFDMGDRVKLTVRSLKEAFDQTMIASHDVDEVQRGPEPIYYERVTSQLGTEHVSRVVRMEGTVATEASTFGEVYLDTDDGIRFKMGLDSELARRGVGFEIGARLEVTGPVLYSFNEYTIVIMRVGQIQEK